MKKSLLAVLILSLLCIGAQKAPEQIQWRPAPHKPGDIASDGDWLVLPKTDVYEVVPSQMGMVPIRDLPESGFREWTEANARAATGHYYSCPAGKRPFLVRAVYADGFVGRLRVERQGNSLAVIWGSLPGSPRNLKHSALVVNLDFTPDAIYYEHSAIPSMP